MTIEHCYPCLDRGVVDNHLQIMRKWYSELYDGREINCATCGEIYVYTRAERGYVGTKKTEEETE